MNDLQDARAENMEPVADTNDIVAAPESTESSPDSETLNATPTDQEGESEPDLDAEAIEFENDGKRSAYIPRERFDKVNGEYKRLTPYLSYIEKIEAAGGVEALEQFQREQAEREQEAAKEKVLTQYQGTETERLKQYVDSGMVDESLLPQFAADFAELEYRRSQDAAKTTTDLEQQFEVQFKETVAALRETLPHLSEYAIRLAATQGEDIMEAAQKSHNEAEARFNNEQLRRDKAKGAIATASTPMIAGAARTEQSTAIPKPGTPEFAAYDARMRQQMRNR